MKESEKALIFLCSRAPKLDEKKLSFRIATYLEQCGLGELAGVEMLAFQQSSEPATRRKMIFINDCNSSCVKLLTQGFDAGTYLYLDVKEHRSNPGFDIEQFAREEVFSKMMIPV